MKRLLSNNAKAVVAGASRTMWDPNGHQPEAAFLDKKDFEQIYPVVKPKVTGGGYGYSRGVHWGTFLVPNPSIRCPHERRRLNPKAAKVVTVFGASGFLGAEITRELLEHPDIEKVRACTRYPTLIPEGSDLDKLLVQYPDKLELHECDVTDRIQVNVAANGADTLIFAVDFHNEYANNSHFDVFVTGTTNVSWTARSVRAERVIFCNGLDATFASESNYVDMRARGEDAVGANFPDATLMRFGHLYGANYRYSTPGKFVYPVWFPKTLLQPTWVVDAARAVVRSCRASRAVRRKLDLGGPETLSHYDFARENARLFHPRFVFAAPNGLCRLACRVAPWVWPNPPFDDNWFLTMELDQVNRSQAMFDMLDTWDRIAYTPHSMQDAADIYAGKKTLTPLHLLDKEYDRIEKKEKDELTEEELAAQQEGIHRAKAEPGYGRSEGLELLAQEIYPGQQFRMRALEGAKYPDTVKNPHPVAIE